MTFWQGRTVAITGGSGSFGKAFTRFLLSQDIRAVRILSRGEHRQAEMEAKLPDSRLRFILCDVRDRSHLRRAFDGCSIVIHAAALKRIEKSEYNAIEFLLTNTIGAVNVVEAALDAGVERVIALSTDKASAPITHYGVTKLAAERIFAAANRYGGDKVAAVVTRYGNVFGSEGSVLPLWIKQRDSGEPLTITDAAATRFWMTMGEAVSLVAYAAELGISGTVIIPKLPAVRMVDVAEAVAPGRPRKIIGMRGVEKMAESLISADESALASEVDGYNVLGLPCPSGIPERYASDNRQSFLSIEEIRTRIPQAMEEANA